MITFFLYFLSHCKCRNFSIIRQIFSKNIADAKDEFVWKDEGAGAGIKAAAAALAGVGGVEAVAAPEAKAEVEIEVSAEHGGVAGGKTAAEAVTL